MIGVGLIGFGHWGPNLARNLLAAGLRLVAVADTRSERLALARERHPEAELCQDWQDVLCHPAVAAVVIATPATSHFRIALAALVAGRHVLVEKPMATSVTEAGRLLEVAAARGLTLMVDHTFLYDGSVQAIGRMLRDGSLGEPRRYDSVRAGPRPAVTDVDVLWDLGSHDLAILDYLFPRRPESVSAVARQPRAIGSAAALIDDADLTLDYAGGLVARIHVGWRSPVKLRRIVISCGDGQVRFDERDGAAPLRVEGGAGSPALDLPPPASGETLAGVVEDFIAAIATGRRPLANAESALRVTALLEEAGASLRDGGRSRQLAALSA